ncbi:heterogeneous nuclear ribonucleoprotein Q [Trifolium repens]|nr:heterogeneous nuclear ribonucleoprotein Q [Trifolium repens]
MPKGKPNSSPVAKQSEPEKPVESDEKVDLEEGNDPEEEMEEEVEYEEVEEEEEVEEIEEEVEEEEDPEEVEEEEEEEEEEEVEEVEEDDATENHSIDDEEKKKHAELLSLPPHKSEVYLGGIPLDALTEDLKEFCERIGEVVQVRIMKGKDSSENKGFAFVTYRNVELATKAIEELNNTVFKGRKIKCSTSQAKNRLFIGNIPRSWGEKDLKKVVNEIGPGVTAVELVKDMKNISNNRGFAFIDYHNNACAEYSKQKMTNPTFKLGENSPTVSWADPKNADSSASSQVKAVYVKNLPKNVTQEQLKKLFEHHGKITKVVLPPPKPGQEKNRIGFVHFAERSNAMKALKNTERYELEGNM